MTRKGVQAEFMEEKDAIRYRCFMTKEWKLAEYPGESFGELYHLTEDPKEQHNLWAEPEYLMIKYELLRQYLQEMQLSKRSRCSGRGTAALPVLKKNGRRPVNFLQEKE